MTNLRTPWTHWLTLLLLMATSMMLLSAQEMEDQDNYASDIFSNIFNSLVKDGEIELLGHYCSYSTRPYFLRWRLKFKSKVWCPGWTLVYGSASESSSVSNSIQNAIINFIQKAYQDGVITEEDAKPWLQGSH
uniref:Anti-lipopolysaccharide factor 5 n=1 Tax=Penaeus vannamei TaxID=6689 RepID=A0A2R3SJY7_PENVA|nr:anti-lipopolysaccharide factor 5 [Penaeus vannamei]